MAINKPKKRSLVGGALEMAKKADPLKNKGFLMRESEAKALDLLATEKGLSKSVMVRTALKEVYGITATADELTVGYNI